VVQVLVTFCILLVQVVGDSNLNPFLRRGQKAIKRLTSLDDGIADIVSKEFEMREEEIEELEEISEGELKNIQIGIVQRGDAGFRVLRNAIDRHRHLSGNVSRIGLIKGPYEIVSSPELHDSVNTGLVPLSPNAALFVDYNNGEEPINRENIIFRPSSPTTTLQLNELQFWIREEALSKVHYLTVAMAIIWVTISILLL